MRIRMAFVVDADDVGSVRAVAQQLADEHDAKSWDVAVIDHPYTVVGVVKGKPSERWVAHVYAPDRSQAEAKALESPQPRSVATVLDGHQEVV